MSLMRGAFFLLPLVIVGCGPSPALQPTVVTPCEIEEEDEQAVPPAKPIEYVRIDEWQAPPSVRDLESRIEPRGNEPPSYVSLPSLTLHREISPMTTWRHGAYWH